MAHRSYAFRLGAGPSGATLVTSMKNGEPPHSGRPTTDMGTYGFVDAAPVVSAVGDDGSEGLSNLVQQWADLRGVIHVMDGQCRGDNAPDGDVQADVQLPPRMAPARAVLLDQPVTGAAQLHTGAVDQQTHRLVGWCRRGSGR